MDIDAFFKIADKNMQTFIRSYISVHNLAKALSGLAKEKQEIVYRNMTESTRAELEKELERLGETPREDIEKARKMILKTVFNLFPEEGP